MLKYVFSLNRYFLSTLDAELYEKKYKIKKITFSTFFEKNKWFFLNT